MGFTVKMGGLSEPEQGRIEGPKSLHTGPAFRIKLPSLSIASLITHLPLSSWGWSISDPRPSYAINYAFG